MIPLPDPTALADELANLLDQRAQVNRRLRELTGCRLDTEAVSVATQFLADGRPLRLPKKPAARDIPTRRPDDRDRPTSIRAVSGGLPTLGKGHR